VIGSRRSPDATATKLARRLGTLEIALASLLASGAAAADRAYEFNSEGRRHVFHGSFSIPAERSCVLQVLFGHEHVVRFVTGADAVELIDQGEDWNEIRYVYDFWLFSHSESYRRWLTDGEPALSFELVGVEHQGFEVALPRSSSGYYDLKASPGGLTVHYRQQVELGPGPLVWAYQQLARRRAIAFLEDLEAYLESGCAVTEHLWHESERLEDAREIAGLAALESGADDRLFGDATSPERRSAKTF
jgi:hypothetical protein